MEEKKIKGKQKVKNVKKKEPNKMKNEQNNKLVEENAKLNEKLLRVMAEMQNMKRRNEEEISKLCGDKLVRVGKDKKEETRPLVTVSELQRMKPDEIILIKQRCAPYRGKLKMDWDTDFGFGRGVDHYGKNVVYPQRTMDDIKTFDLKEFVRKQKQEKLRK